MGRGKKRNTPIEIICMGIFLFIQTIVVLIVRLVIFVYDLVTFFTSKYNSKSGIGFFKMYFSKGYYGEFALYRKTIRIFGKESVLTNVYLDNKNTETTEIDVLAVSAKGIYVLEMKNYAGYIYGSEQDQHWTQVLNKWTKNKFYNPLRQNYAHTKAVESYLQISNELTIPIIVFSNRSKLNKISVGENHQVFQYRNAIRYIKRYEAKQKDLISEQQKEEYLVKLLGKCNMPDEVKQKHIEEVKKLHSKSSQS